jgi:putrescine transport system permease protein
MSQASNKVFAKGWMLAVYIFLYLPIITLVVFSFNDSKLVTVVSCKFALV